MTKREQQLKDLTKQQSKLLEQQAAQLAERDTTIKLLQQKIDLLIKRIYAKSSEKLTPEEQLLLFGEDQPGKPQASSDPKDDLTDVAPEEVKSNANKKKRKHPVPRLPENLPILIDKVIIPPEVLADPDSYEEIAEDYQDLLDMTPASYHKRRTINKKYRHKTDKSSPPLQALMPAAPIPGTLCAPGFAAHLIVSKYCDHLPQYRLESILKTRHSIHLPRQTLNRWNTAIADRLTPINEAIKSEILSSDYLQADETPIRYLCPGHGKTKQGYLWIYNDPTGSVYYQWSTTRGHKNLIETLGTPEVPNTDDTHFKGHLQCDGYSAYLTYQNLLGALLILLSCLAHIRRKFYEARDLAPQQLGLILRLISHLYAIEEKLRRQRAGPQLRETVRCHQSVPLMKRIHTIITKIHPRYSPKSPITLAINYALGQWEQQEEYLRNGHLEIDNNLAENAVRPTKLGMKNWLFFGDAEAGHTSAKLYTIIENCKRHGLNPEAYLKQVLTHLPADPTKAEAASLTPQAIAKTQKRLPKAACQ